MKKSKEELKKEIFNYLRKVSNHTFVSESNSDRYLKVFFVDDRVMVLLGDGIYESVSNIDYCLDTYESNYKQIVKQSLFGDYPYHGLRPISIPSKFKSIKYGDFKAVRNTRYLKNKIKSIIHSIENPSVENVKDRSIIDKIINIFTF